MRFILTTFSLIILVSCTIFPRKSESELRPYQLYRYWEFNHKKKLTNRITGGEQELIEGLPARLQMKIESTPRVYQPTNDDIQEIKDSLNRLPREIQNYLENHLLGIVVAQDLGINGSTSFVMDDETYNLKGGYIVIDKSTLHTTYEKLNNERMMQFFKEGDWKLSFELRVRGKALSALDYVLLHEAAHLIHFSNPFTYSELGPVWNLQPFKFTMQSWRSEKGAVINRYPFFRGNNLLNFYHTTRKTENEKIAYFYKMLKRTNFTSLYSVWNHFEDFAESFTSYYLKKMNAKRKVVVNGPNKESIIFSDCIALATCEEKIFWLSQLETLLKNEKI